MKFRALKENEIDCRVATVKQNVISLLLYKNARCDMKILDETVGAENWQREHYECKNNLFCRVGILCENGWVYKSDCGVESYAEKEKGESSDSFKRACFCWGIGRELYTAPFIWITSEQANIKDSGRTDNRGNKIYTTNDRFEVEKIIIENGEIIALSIINKTKQCRAFMWQKEKKKNENCN